MAIKYPVRGIKQCLNCKITWDRDINAAYNIRDILIEWYETGYRIQAFHGPYTINQQ